MPSGQGKRKRTQNDRLLEYLKDYGSLTQLEAFNGLGICRLSERIRELETQGHLIGHEWVKTSGGARVIRYWYLGDGH